MLINNAAIARGKYLDELSLDQFKKTIDINLFSVVHLNKLFMSQKSIIDNDAKKGDFHIVHMCSVASRATSIKNSDYCTSKFAMRGYISCLR